MTEITAYEGRAEPLPRFGGASQGMTAREYMNFIDDLRLNAPYAGAISDAGGLPHETKLQRGGIIGSVDLIDCVNSSASPWFFGPFGFVLANAKPLPFHPLRGRIGFFDPDDKVAVAKPKPRRPDLFG